MVMRRLLGSLFVHGQTLFFFFMFSGTEAENSGFGEPDTISSRYFQQRCPRNIYEIQNVHGKNSRDISKKAFESRLF